MSETATHRKIRKNSAVKVKTSMPKAGPGIDTERYWVGCTLDCPIQNPCAGGITFPQFRGDHLSQAGDLIPAEKRHHGIYADLSADQVRAVVAGVGMRIVRIFGARDPVARFDDADMDSTPKRLKNAQMYMKDGKNYSPAPNDAPLARFLYMHKLSDMSAEDMHKFPPETMEEE